MIEAFHLVPSREAMNRIMEQGEILPGAMRLDPDIFLGKCILEFNELADKASIDDPEVKLNLVVLSALRDLSRESIAGLRRLQRQLGVEATQRDTQYACPDLLAGDLERVFLSIASWPQWVHQISEEIEPHGFVFDAHDLIRRGARIRPKDLLRKYRWALEDLLRTKMRSRDKAYAAALKTLKRVQRDGELRGSDAMAFLADGDMAGRTKSTIELVWDGPIPLEWAVAVKPEMA